MGVRSSLFPSNPACALLFFFHCFLLGLRFILGLFSLELGDLATPIIIPRVKFPELIQESPDLGIDNGFSFSGLFADQLRR